eukprot:15468942-Alexandrium_andersonii.AAC.1
MREADLEHVAAAEQPKFRPGTGHPFAPIRAAPCKHQRMRVDLLGRSSVLRAVPGIRARRGLDHSGDDGFAFAFVQWQPSGQRGSGRARKAWCPWWGLDCKCRGPAACAQ